MNLTKKERFIGIVLAVLILFSTLNSAYFFLGVLNMNIFKWLTFNACSLVSIIYLACLVVYLARKNIVFLAFTIFPLYYYGTMGLFVMPWIEANFFAHITHIIITINIIWILLVALKNVAYRELAIGLLVSILVFVPVIALIQTYVQTHAIEFMQILQGM